jgi:hypothetical protein
VALTVPSLLSPIGPVLESGTAVVFSPFVTIPSGPTVAMGAGGVTAVGDTLQDVWSVGPATLTGTQVTGTLYAATTINVGSTVHASNTTPPINPPTSLTWNVTYPTGTANNFVILPTQTLNLAPALYGSIVVNPGATLELSTGTYYLTSLAVSLGGVVTLNQTNGPVVIYVNGALSLNGPFTTNNNAPPDLMVAYLGQIPVVLGCSLAGSVYNGALLAPYTALALVSGNYSGFFEALDITVAGPATITYQAPFAVVGAALAGCGVLSTGSATSSDAGAGTFGYGFDGGFVGGVDAGPVNAASLQACTSLVSIAGATPALTGIQLGAGDAGANAAYQAAIARYCTAPGTSQCLQTLIGLANADYFAAAVQAVNNTFSPAQHLALDRDRYGKLWVAENDASAATAFCNGPDSDGDWIPDSEDKCPGTPALAATDMTGCPLSTLPPAPAASTFQQYLPVMNFLLDPFCTGAPSPSEVSGAAVWQTFGPQNGMYIVAAAVTNQPPGCRVFYEFEVRTMGPNGPVAPPFMVAWEASQAVQVVGGLPGLPTVPAGYIQFNANSATGGGQAQLAALVGSPYMANFRVRAINGSGMAGPWGEWKSTVETDCLHLGVICQM